MTSPTVELPNRLPADGGETPAERVAAFIARGRQQRLHGRGSLFEASHWDVSAEVVRRPGVPTQPGSLHLSFAAVDRGPPDFGGFMRAYIGGLPRSGHSTLQTLVQAAGLVAEAMEAGGVVSVVGIDVATLNKASALARRRHSPSRASQMGNAVLALGTVLHSERMTNAALTGALRPIQLPPGPDMDRTAEAFAARSMRLLPSRRLLAALADAYRLAVHPSDVVVTRIAALLLSAAARVNEVLALDEEPEVERTIDGIICLGLRCRGSKGTRDGVKWVAPAMAPVVRTALTDLRRVTREGGEMKRWYDDHPTSLYLPFALEHLRGRAELADDDVHALLGPLPGARELRQQAVKAGLSAVSFAQVEACLLSLLPGRMRDGGGPESHPLLVVPAGTFGQRGGGSSACMFEMVSYRHVSRALAGPLFDRLGLDADAGANGHTHAFRHLLVTEALRGGMPSAEVSEWCGHAHRRDVLTYDHRTAAEMRAGVDRAWKFGRRTTSPLSPGHRPARDGEGPH